MKLQNKNLVMDVELTKFIQVYENVLESNTCKELIELYENNQYYHIKYENSGYPNFTELNLSENAKVKKTNKKEKVCNILVDKIVEYRNKYYEYIDSPFLPSEHDLEDFRIKKYKPDGEDYFDTHVDAHNLDTCSRYISFLFYLNDVDCGGETEFVGLTIKPEIGKLVIFPPLWMFPHRGNPPISGPKYILSSYLHYV